jgi:hypothetical protein
MAKFYVPFLIMIPEEMKEDINVLGLWIQHRIFGNADGTGAIAKQRNTLKNPTKIPQSGHHSKQMRITASESNILSLYDGLGYARLLARRPRDKRRSQKLTSPRSRLAIQAVTHKICIRIPTQW